MALNIRSLVLEASVPFANDTAPINFYKYATPDAAATVVAAGYFNNARDKLRVNDVITVMAVATGVGDILQMIVTAVPASGNITVAVNGEAAGT